MRTRRGRQSRTRHPRRRSRGREPSDTAPALVALDAQMVNSTRGERVVEAKNFFIGPGTASRG
jgi:CO/xanthine dehydrogenase FAD-binding subunit